MFIKLQQFGLSIYSNRKKIFNLCSIKKREIGRVLKRGALNGILETTVLVPVKTGININTFSPFTVKIYIPGTKQNLSRVVQ
jgi:hypothetical protein